MKALLIVISSIATLAAGERLTFEDRVEITRGLTAEYATCKIALPRTKKALVFRSDGTYDKTEWQNSSKELGPAARLGDLVQITKIDIGGDKITLEINHGNKSGRHWYDHIEVGGPVSTRQSGMGGDSNAIAGTVIVVQFDKAGVPAMKAEEFKKMLAPILDFDKHSATTQYVETLPPEIKKAIEEKKAVETMDREQVLLALGRPRSKTRETKDGYDQEDWIYGEPPGKITFVTFRGNKVFKVRDVYAGMGGSTVPKVVPQ